MKRLLIGFCFLIAIMPSALAQDGSGTIEG